MYKFRISFLALNDSISFDINSMIKETVESFAKELMFIFSEIDEENRKINIISFQQNSTITQTKILEFTERYKLKMPQINAVSAFFRKLQSNEHFYFLPNLELNQIDQINLHEHLRAISEDKDFEEIKKQTNELFGELLSKYALRAYGHNRIQIGEKIKSKRICRFCTNTRQTVTFNSIAHALSEAIGNKNIILFEECDVCNNEFSRTIEPDLIQYFSLFRTIYDVKGKAVKRKGEKKEQRKGKGGSKDFKGKNFKITNDETVRIEFTSDDDRPDEFSMPYNIKLEAKEKVCFQNIYKCLCKYFLSVIDNENLIHFKETIKWINGDIEINKLPLVAEMISYHTFTKQPQIITYFRKTDDTNIPFAVCELHFTCKIFVFIIPKVENETIDFTTKENYEIFWNTFQHFKKSEGWAFIDYSNNLKRDFILNLSFTKEENENE